MEPTYCISPEPEEVNEGVCEQQQRSSETPGLQINVNFNNP